MGEADAVSPDITALTARPRRGEVRSFWRTLVAEHPYVRAPRSRIRVAVLLLGVVLSGLGALTAVLGTVSLLTRRQGATPGEVIGAAVAALLFALVLMVLWRAAVRTGRRRMWPRQHWTLARFAADNGFTYHPGPFPAELPARNYRGRLLQTRAVRWVTPEGRLIEWSDFEQDWGTSAYHETRFGGWIRIGLRRPLPRIVLPPAHGRMRALTRGSEPAEPAPRVEDAPSFVSDLVADASGWDVEITDDSLLMTRSRDVVTTAPAEWSEILRTTAAALGGIERAERLGDGD
jgi:hypothetical protein